MRMCVCCYAGRWTSGAIRCGPNSTFSWTRINLSSSREASLLREKSEVELKTSKVARQGWTGRIKEA